MRASLIVLLAAGCSGSGADAPHAGSASVAEPTHAGSSARPVLALPPAAPAASPGLRLGDLLAVEGQDIFATIDWTVEYADLVRRFGPVTRVVDRKYFWAAAEGDRCAMFWIGKRKQTEQVAIAVGVMSTEPGGIGHDWCIAMVTGGPLPARSGGDRPSTGYDTPTPD